MAFQVPGVVSVGDMDFQLRAVERRFSEAQANRRQSRELALKSMLAHSDAIMEARKLGLLEKQVEQEGEFRSEQLAQLKRAGAAAEERRGAFSDFSARLRENLLEEEARRGRTAEGLTRGAEGLIEGTPAAGVLEGAGLRPEPTAESLAGRAGGESFDRALERTIQETIMTDPEIAGDVLAVGQTVQGLRAGELDVAAGELGLVAAAGDVRLQSLQIQRLAQEIAGGSGSRRWADTFRLIQKVTDPSGVVGPDDVESAASLIEGASTEDEAKSLTSTLIQTLGRAPGEFETAVEKLMRERQKVTLPADRQAIAVESLEQTIIDVASESPDFDITTEDDKGNVISRSLPDILAREGAAVAEQIIDRHLAKNPDQVADLGRELKKPLLDQSRDIERRMKIFENLLTASGVGGLVGKPVARRKLQQLKEELEAVNRLIQKLQIERTEPLKKE